MVIRSRNFHEKNKLVRVIVITFLFFNGISALFGGCMLITDPSGEIMQMPLDMLKNSPFSDFLIPGIILFALNGVSSILIAVLSILKVKFYPYCIILQGGILILWLTIQIIMIRMFSPPFHIPYYFVGVILMVLGIMMLRKNTIHQ